MQPFGMVVLAADPHVDAASAAQAGATLCSLEDLLEQSDVVVVACLLNESTRHLLNAERLRSDEANRVSDQRRPRTDHR